MYIDDQAGSLNTLLNILYGLLGLSVIIALLGVTNTMSLSVYERTRELGLMRAVGMTGPQLRSSVRYESSLVALVGSLAGLVLGVFFGWLAYLLVRDTFPVFAIPWTTLVIIAGVGVVAGIIAGWRPAVRASELNVLDASSTPSPTDGPSRASAHSRVGPRPARPGDVPPPHVACAGARL